VADPVPVVTFAIPLTLRNRCTDTAQVVVLGTASEPEVQRQWEDMAREYGRGGDARLVLRYDEGLAHRIYAGADMILVGTVGTPRGGFACTTQNMGAAGASIAVGSRSSGASSSQRCRLPPHVRRRLRGWSQRARAVRAGSSLTPARSCAPAPCRPAAPGCHAAMASCGAPRPTARAPAVALALAPDPLILRAVRPHPAHLPALRWARSTPPPPPARCAVPHRCGTPKPCGVQPSSCWLPDPPADADAPFPSLHRVLRLPLPGTVPIVNHTGGLADTIRDVADQGVPDRDRNGFVFSGEGPAG
jgi:hypothetical protein